MPTRSARRPAALLALALAAAPAAAQTPEMVEEVRRRLQESRDAQAPPPAAKPLPAALPGVPDGAVARLGDTRLRHAGVPVSVAFSPDGRRVYSGGEDGMLRVWDAATGEAVSALPFPGGTVRRVRPTHGGARLALLADGRVRFLDPGTLKEAAAYPVPHGDDFAVSADGALIAHVGAEGQLLVAELATGLPKLELPAGFHYAFHPDCRSLAVSDARGRVTLYRLAGGKPVASFDAGGPVAGLAFRSDGKRVACGVGGVGKVWDLPDGKAPRLAAEVKGAGRVRGWVGDGRLAAGDDTSVGVYDLAREAWDGRAGGVSGDWAVSPDGKTVAASSAGGLRVRMFDLTTGKQLHAENDTFPDAALLAPTPDGRAVFVLAGDAAFLWPVDKRAAAPAGTLPARAVHAASGAGRLAVATPDAVLVYHGFDPARPLPAKPARTLSEYATTCRSVAVSPDGTKVAYSGQDAKQDARTVVADAATGKTLRVLPAPTAGLAVAFAPDGAAVAVVGRDGFVRLSATAPPADGADPDLWKVRVQRGPRGAAAFSPDGTLLAVSSSGTVKVLRATDGSEVFSAGGLFDNGLFQQAAFTPDGRLLVTASEGASGGVLVWEVATGSLARRFATGFGSVTRLGLFPDGSRAAAAGAEEVVTVWDLTGRHGKAGPTAAELAAAWVALGSSDAAVGYPASRTLAAGGAHGVRAVAAGLELLPADPPPGESLRLVRAVQVLEDVGGAEAKKLLARVARLGDRPGDAATAALKRMGK